MKQLKVFKSGDTIPFLVAIVDAVWESEYNSLEFNYEGYFCMIHNWDYYHVEEFEIEEFQT